MSWNGACEDPEKSCAERRENVYKGLKPKKGESKQKYVKSGQRLLSKGEEGRKGAGKRSKGQTRTGQ